jgi:hypothetical protein
LEFRYLESFENILKKQNALKNATNQFNDEQAQIGLAQTGRRALQRAEQDQRKSNAKLAHSNTTAESAVLAQHSARLDSLQKHTACSSQPELFSLNANRILSYFTILTIY